MPDKHSDADIDELLEMAKVSNPAARRWLTDALAAAQAVAEHRRKRQPEPTPAQRKASLDNIEQLADMLIVGLAELNRQLSNHDKFWGTAAFGPISAVRLEDAPVVSALENISKAAQNARRMIGRPPNRLKQRIVDLALAFCAQFSSLVPTTNEKNFFRDFAEQFYKLATGLSVFDKGQGIDRQIRNALRTLPIQKQRAAFLNKTRAILA